MSPNCRRILYHLSHQGGPRILEWVAYPSPADLPHPGIKPGSPELQADSLPAELPGKPTRRVQEAEMQSSDHECLHSNHSSATSSSEVLSPLAAPRDGEAQPDGERGLAVLC